MIDKLVVTLVALAVFVATSAAIEELNAVCEPDIIVGVSAFTNAIVANSVSINAPAEVTLSVSVTSADASIPSNLSNSVVFIRPETDVVATGIVASVPSEETITLASVVPVIVKLVETFVTFAVLASISANKVFASLSSVTASSASWVVPTPPSVIWMSLALAVIPVPPTTFRVASPVVAPPVKPSPATTLEISPEPAPAPISERTSAPVLKSTFPLVSNTKNLSVSVPALETLLSANADNSADEPDTITFFHPAIFWPL